jgi:hypothetical protein
MEGDMTAPTYAQILKREEQHTRRRSARTHQRPLTTVMLTPLGLGWPLNSCDRADGMDDVREERGDAR